MKFTLYVHDEDPATAAAILRERSRLMFNGQVYVLPHVRRWPGGKAAAMKAAGRRKHVPVLRAVRGHA